MRIRLLLLAALLAVLAACGSSGDPAQGGTATPGGPAATSDTATDAPTDAPAGNGNVDCAKVQAAITELIVPIQLMAQIRDPDAVSTFKEGLAGTKLEPDRILAALHDLHELDGVSSVLGNPKDAVDAYEDAATALKTLFDKASPTQADVDAYNDHIGELSTFLMHQAAISGAVDEADC